MRYFLYLATKSLFSVSFVVFLFLIFIEFFKEGFVSHFFYIISIFIVLIVLYLLMIWLGQGNFYKKSRFLQYIYLLFGIIGALLFMAALSSHWESYQNYSFYVIAGTTISFFLMIVYFIPFDD